MERKRKKKKKKRKTRGSEIDNKDLFWPNTLSRWGFRWLCTSLIEENNWSNTKGATKNQRNFIKMRNAYIFSHFTFGSKVRGKSLLEANKNYACVGFLFHQTWMTTKLSKSSNWRIISQSIPCKLNLTRSLSYSFFGL